MENLTAQPKKLPIILILIGTTILAFPAAYGTFALFDTSSSLTGGGGNSIFAKDSFGKLLFFVSAAGFALFAGYILTAIFRRHSRIFWFFSTVYNFILSGCYLYFLLAEFFYKATVNFNIIFEIMTNPVLLLPLWTIFVTVSSAYYFRFCFSSKKSVLP